MTCLRLTGLAVCLGSASVALERMSALEKYMSEVGMDEIASRINRGRSWIIRQAVAECLAEEQRRHELTLKALRDVDEERTTPRQDVLEWAERRKRERREALT